MGYGRNILLGPTSPKPNRQAATVSNTVSPDTRKSERCMKGWGIIFMTKYYTNY
jgi:hypothetical protein